MINVVSTQNMRKSDAYTIQNFVDSKELMKRAGDESFRVIKEHFQDLDGKKILVLCGSGNNAGDGYVIADRLCEDGANVSIFLLYDKFSDDGKYYFDKIKNKVTLYTKDVISENVEKISFSDYDIVIDCIYGTGFYGEIKDNLVLNIINKLNEESVNGDKPFVVSIDINSGLNGDSGLCKNAVVSDLTISIGTYKTGHFLNMAKDYIRQKMNVDIGINLVEKPYHLITKDDVRTAFAERKNFANKGDYGYIALIGGSVKYSGAIRLSNMAATAMRVGAGVVKVALPKVLANVITPLILESTLFPLSDDGDHIVFVEEEINELTKNVKSVACGMGITANEETEKMVSYLINNYDKNLVLDADALNALSKILTKNKNILKNAKAQVVLTPHLKEFMRLVNANEDFVKEIITDNNKSIITIEDIQNNMIHYAVSFARVYKVIVLLKGTTTVITDGEEVFLVDRGAPGMATAGSGDVLSGIIASLLGQKNENVSTLTKVAVGAYINGVAGEKANEKYGAISMLASDTAQIVNEVMKVIKENT